MRLLHVHSGNLFGGVETLLVTLARYRALCPAMDSRIAVCFEGRLQAELAALGQPPRMLAAARLRRPWTVARARRRLATLLREEPIDAVVCHGPWPHLLFAGIARHQRLPVVLWLHGPVQSHWLDRLALRWQPDLVICNSRFTAQSLAGPTRDVPSAVVYCPVAARASAPGARAAVRAALGVPADTVVIVQVGRLEPWKGNREHLTALAALRDVPNWVSWHVGGAQRPQEQRHLDALVALAEREGLGSRVRFLGERRDVPDLLAAADVYVQPNTGAEPFGQTFVEALLAGLPVVTSAFGGALEIVDDGCGVLVPPGDTAALARTLGALIGDPGRRARLGGEGPARARALCDPATQLAAIRTTVASTLVAA
jgi:glycosyltransferase involved in cell wall biosynthesis